MPAWDSLHPLMEKFRHRRWRKLSTRRCKEGHIKIKRNLTEVSELKRGSKNGS